MRVLLVPVMPECLRVLFMPGVHGAVHLPGGLVRLVREELLLLVVRSVHEQVRVPRSSMR